MLPLSPCKQDPTGWVSPQKRTWPRGLEPSAHRCQSGSHHPGTLQPSLSQWPPLLSGHRSENKRQVWLEGLPFGLSGRVLSQGTALPPRVWLAPGGLSWGNASWCHARGCRCCQSRVATFPRPRDSFQATPSCHFLLWQSSGVYSLEETLGIS